MRIIALFAKETNLYPLKEKNQDQRQQDEEQQQR